MSKIIITKGFINKAIGADINVEGYSIGDTCEDARLLYEYAKKVTRARLEDAEPIIMQDPHIAYLYTKDVIKMRCEQAEPYILKSAYASYQYARDIIRTRWEEAEPIIKENTFVACLYAGNVLKCRWFEIEPEIFKDTATIVEYVVQLVLGQCKGNIDPSLLEGISAMCLRIIRDVSDYNK